MPSFCTIPLTKGYAAKVDWEDMRLLEFRWSIWDSRGSDHLYAKRQVGGKTLFLHHAILPAKQGFRVDHRNGDGLDCRRGNLRYLTPTGNSRNRRGARKDSSTGLLGVYPRKNGKFQSMIRHEGKLINIGTFDTLEEAAAARLRKEQELWGIQPQRAHLFEETA